VCACPNSVADAPHNGRGHQPQPANKIVKPIKFPAQPQEWKTVSMRDRPTPDNMQQCEHRIRRPHIGKRTATIIGHSHPRRNPAPSDAHIKITRDLIRVGQILKIDRSPRSHHRGP